MLIFEQESAKIFPKTLDVLFKSDSDPCKEEFKRYIEGAFENNGDPSFINFLKSVLGDFKEQYVESYQESNIMELIDKVTA